jgi:UDP-N-acetylglucosamine--N-acetylmuramyl-(pentapeptide) pyrophosphoryl-undecaprenol N-acetylglucosamine transferase
MSRVLFAGGGTGGHLYPALALGEAVRAERVHTEIHFVGAQRGVEARVLPQRNVPHTLLPLLPIFRERAWRNWRLLPSLTRSFVSLARLFASFRPNLVVGTGGYASGPACFYAVTRGVPVAVQEQNSWPGLTTRLLARWAKQVHLGFPEAAQHLRPGRNTRVLTLGNPIRPPDPSLDRIASRAAFGLSAEATVVLVVGGSQGARAVNESLLSAMRLAKEARVLSWPDDLEILWATGPAHIESVSGRLASLGLGGKVRALGYIEDVPRALAAADLAVSRAGAMMTAELLAWGVPSLLVPLPSAAANHQLHNARALAAAGAALCIEEASLTPESLWGALAELASDGARREKMAAAARARAQPDAARAIARELLTLVSAS